MRAMSAFRRQASGMRVDHASDANLIHLAYDLWRA
jgi:hypothetical protein